MRKVALAIFVFAAIISVSAAIATAQTEVSLEMKVSPTVQVGNIKKAKGAPLILVGSEGQPQVYAKNFLGGYLIVSYHVRSKKLSGSSITEIIDVISESADSGLPKHFERTIPVDPDGRFSDLQAFGVSDDGVTIEGFHRVKRQQLLIYGRVIAVNLIDCKIENGKTTITVKKEN